MAIVAKLQSILDQGVAEEIFPSAQAAVFHRGEMVFEGTAGAATLTTLYDLASLTKVVCTTAAFIAFWAEGKLGPQTPLSLAVPEAAAGAAGVTLGDLLYHRSALPPFLPYFAPVLRAVPELFVVNCPASTRAEVRAEVVDAVKNTPPRDVPRKAALYSDIGFILLGEALSSGAGMPLDQIFEEKVAGPFGLSSRFRRLSAAPPKAAIAPTGQTRPRPPAPGQEGMWPEFPQMPTQPGEVDDDNAFVLDGVAGHAGLFGTASDVARFGQRVLEELAGAQKLAPAALWQRALRIDSETPGSTRAMGFDTPSQESSSAGRFIGNRAPGAVGHLGFTGTSLWIDLGRSLVVALCSNRTWRGRQDTRIKDLRPRFHDAVVEGLAL